MNNLIQEKCVICGENGVDEMWLHCDSCYLNNKVNTHTCRTTTYVISCKCCSSVLNIVTSNDVTYDVNEHAELIELDHLNSRNKPCTFRQVSHNYLLSYNIDIIEE